MPDICFLGPLSQCLQDLVAETTEVSVSWPLESGWRFLSPGPAAPSRPVSLPLLQSLANPGLVTLLLIPASVVIRLLPVCLCVRLFSSSKDTNLTLLQYDTLTSYICSDPLSK